MHSRRWVSWLLICLLVEGFCGLARTAPAWKKNKSDTDDASTDSTPSEGSLSETSDTEGGDSLIDADPEATDTYGDISSNDSMDTNSDGLVEVTNDNTDTAFGGFGIMGSMD